MTQLTHSELNKLFDEKIDQIAPSLNELRDFMKGHGYVVTITTTAKGFFDFEAKLIHQYKGKPK